MTKVQAAANRLQAMLSGDYVYVGRDCKQLHGGMRREAASTFIDQLYGNTWRELWN